MFDLGGKSGWKKKVLTWFGFSQLLGMFVQNDCGQLVFCGEWFCH